MIYTLTLNPALDETVSPAGTRLDPGGKGLNVSKTLLALGVPSVVLGFTAGAQGAELCRLAEAAGLTLAMTPAPGETRRNRKLTDGPRLKEHNEPGPAFDPAAFAAPLRYETLTDDPAIRKQVDDILYDLYGEENPRPLEDYENTPQEGMTMGGMT